MTLPAVADSAYVLSHGLSDFKDPEGGNLIARQQAFADWVDAARAEGLFPFIRHHEHSPDIEATVVGMGGQRYRGINLASQDYLGLSRHPRVVGAAADACRQYGTHSAGSEPMGGGLGEAKHLERELAGVLRHEHVVLFPTGWGAGYGAIKALVRPYDHVLLDALSHDCLQQGARASTPNVHLFAHNDMESLAKRLRKIRSVSPDTAALVVTESLFSMDSDHPDFKRFVSVCREYGATTFVDMAHDFGVLGPAGSGVLAEQGVLDDIDILMGSFSKTFASIGGFVATHARGASYAVRGFSGAYTFSNYLMPAQVAAVREAFAIVRSDEGSRLRAATLERAAFLRSALASRGFEVLGRTSPIVLPKIGTEAHARLTYRRCLEEGVILNSIEYPACRRGEARFRLQTSPRHSFEDLAHAAAVIAGGA